MKGARPLTPEEIQAVSQSFRGKYAVRDKCLFLLGINAVSELDFSNLTMENISQYMDYLKFRLLSGVLQAHGGNQAEAARQLDVGQKFFSQAAGFYQRYKREHATK